MIYFVCCFLYIYSFSWSFLQSLPVSQNVHYQLLCGHCWNKFTGRFPTVSVFFCVFFHILRFSTQHLKTCIQNMRHLCCVLLILYHWTGHFCNYKQMYCFSKLPPVSKKKKKTTDLLPKWLSIWQSILGIFSFFSSSSFRTGAIFQITTFPESWPIGEQKDPPFKYTQKAEELFNLISVPEQRVRFCHYCNGNDANCKNELFIVKLHLTGEKMHSKSKLQLW